MTMLAPCYDDSWSPQPIYASDPIALTLTVELHRLGSPLQDAAVAHLCQLLTDSETLFPTTNLRLIFRQVGSN